MGTTNFQASYTWKCCEHRNSVKQKHNCTIKLFM